MSTQLYKITPEVSAGFYIRAESYADAGYLALAFLHGYDKFFPIEAKDRCYDARRIDGPQTKPGYWQAFNFSGYDQYFGEKILVERAAFSPSAGAFVVVKPRVY